MNVELASPEDFIYSQALSKLERRHARDLDDVTQMHAHGLIEPARLRESFAAIEPQLYRYPAIDPRAFRTAVNEWAARLGR